MIVYGILYAIAHHCIGWIIKLEQKHTPTVIRNLFQMCYFIIIECVRDLAFPIFYFRKCNI